MIVKDVKKGELIHLLNSQGQPQKKVWVKQDYNRFGKHYTLQNYWDINDYRYVKGEKECIIADV